MNCEKCQESLSDFLDGTLTGGDRAKLSAHLEECVPCAKLLDDLGSIVSFCREHRDEYEASDGPPNPHALWLRVFNTLDGERQAAAAAENARRLRRDTHFWSRWMSRSWEFSLPQLATAISAIAIAVGLATVFGLRASRSVDAQLDVNGNRGVGVSSVDDRVRQQQVDIQYWTQRVEQKKTRWSTRMRETFERNMSVYDQAVQDSRKELSQNPHDEVSEEMLHAALHDKMELLKEFSDQ